MVVLVVTLVTPFVAPPPLTGKAGSVSGTHPSIEPESNDQWVQPPPQAVGTSQHTWATHEPIVHCASAEQLWSLSRVGVHAPVRSSQ